MFCAVAAGKRLAGKPALVTRSVHDLAFSAACTVFETSGV
jgi:hypothetical protein